MSTRWFLAIGGFVLALCATLHASPAARLERIVVAADSAGFVTAETKRPFHPWGFNYGHDGRLMEDFWHDDWPTLAADFRKMKSLGANVVRVHLQYGKFMATATEPNRAALQRLARLVQLAEETGLHLDLTGLACYRATDTPAWYDAMDETARWAAQAAFWRAIADTCARSPAVFCYDLMNEPISPGAPREPGKWLSGKPFGGYDFVQFITLDRDERKREDVAVEWIRAMTAAIRSRDSRTLITVGLLPWSRGWGFLSGFVPPKVAPELDFISVHIYPDSKKPEEAMEGLRKFAAGKPVVIEETFPLHCSAADEERFLRESQSIACGWMGHFDGLTLAEIDERERVGTMTIPQSIYRDWQRMFVRLKPEFTGDAQQDPR